MHGDSFLFSSILERCRFIDTLCHAVRFDKPVPFSASVFMRRLFRRLFTYPLRKIGRYRRLAS
jgi:hypothetical protein